MPPYSDEQMQKLLAGSTAEIEAALEPHLLDDFLDQMSNLVDITDARMVLADLGYTKQQRILLDAWIIKRLLDVELC